MIQRGYKLYPTPYFYCEASGAFLPIAEGSACLKPTTLRLYLGYPTGKDTGPARRPSRPRKGESG